MRRSPPAWTWSTRSRTSARRCTIRPSGPRHRRSSARLRAIGRPRRAPLARREPLRSPRCSHLGLSRDDVIAETLRSPKQVESRAKARGLKVPNGIDRFASLRRLAGASENARAPVPGRRDEIVAVFSDGSLTAFHRKEGD